MAQVTKDDFDKLHEKVDGVREDVAEIKGLLKEKQNSWSNFGVIGAILLGLWNMIK